MAVGAEAEDVKTVAVRLEALGVGELADGFGHILLEAGWQRDVDGAGCRRAGRLVCGDDQDAGGSSRSMLERNSFT